MSPTEIVQGMWQAVSDRDWEKARTYYADDCVFYDIPTGPTIAAIGPDDIIKKLSISVDPLAAYANHPGLLLTNGTDVLFEHSETWTWASGEIAVLHFVSVHKVHDGKITLWKDYWDMSELTNNAPAGWYESFATSDLSWISDATGKV
ncbi:nuclear transport factor 2 family protein [Nocardia neocaledoniensis]|uniref:nuclear transport factor 2 family protein n=1 Tax=Nocardia neocaledoniensis TaxID=236511 RepID=UPI00245465F3|nr:limonene-1,2-epoxide hydrolase family protein [Nocardia neocaledoniensis]